MHPNDLRMTRNEASDTPERIAKVLLLLGMAWGITNNALNLSLFIQNIGPLKFLEK